MDDLSRFCCQNSQCPDFGLRNAGNLTVTGRLGKFRQYRLLYCRTCRARFSERKGTPLYRAHLPEDKILSILEHIHEGCGVLKTVRLVKVHPDTVSHYSRASVCMPAMRTTNWWPTRLRPASSRWMRSGRSLPRRRRTAMRTTPRTSFKGTAGTTWRSTRSTGWSSR